MTKTLYRSVFEAVIYRIICGDYVPGSMLPSEFDLADEFNVSQGTVRKALTELEQKGVIERRQGKGSFVTLRTPENSLFHFFRLRDANGKQVVPELADEAVIRREATPDEHACLFGEPKDVFQISRRRIFNSHLLSYEISVVPAPLFPGLTERTPLPNTLYVLFQQAYSCAIISAEDRLSACLVGPELAVTLNVPEETPAILSQRRAFDLSERLVELRRSIYLTDNVYYSVIMD